MPAARPRGEETGARVRAASPVRRTPWRRPPTARTPGPATARCDHAPPPGWPHDLPPETAAASSCPYASLAQTSTSPDRHLAPAGPFPWFLQGPTSDWPLLVLSHRGLLRSLSPSPSWPLRAGPSPEGSAATHRVMRLCHRRPRTPPVVA